MYGSQFHLWPAALFQAKEKNRMEQQRMQEEIMRINAETLRVKEQRMKEEKLADIKAMEYIKKKQVSWKSNWTL